MSSAKGGAGYVSASKKACSVLAYARNIIRGSRKEIEGARSSIDEFSTFGCCIPAGGVLVDRLLRVRDTTEAFYGLDRHD